MRPNRVLVLTSAVAVAIVTTAAPAAMAYDRDSYSYAAGHMIDASDIPANLGTFKPNGQFSVFPGDKSMVCDVPAAVDSQPDVTVNLAKSKFQYWINYNGKKFSDPTINVTVQQYAGAAAAIKAFAGLKKSIRKCSGSGSSSYTGDDGTTTTYSTQVSIAVVPGVSVVGVPSLSVTLDNRSESAPSGSTGINDTYAVFSLVGDTIIQTSFYANGSKNLTTAQRASVNQVAFNAITEWTD